MKTTAHKIIILIVALCGVAFIAKQFVLSLEKSVESKQLMLCNSAKKSGNEIYLAKCQCYYSGADVSCIEN